VFGQAVCETLLHVWLEALIYSIKKSKPNVLWEVRKAKPPQIQTGYKYCGRYCFPLSSFLPHTQRKGL